MNYYNRNPGDMAKKTPHLSMAEMGALAIMEDWCYGTEQLLPLNEDRLFAICRAKSAQEKRICRQILEEFFTRTDHGWINFDIENAIKESVGKSGKASASARARWSKHHANAMRTHSEGIANGGADALQMHCEGNATRARPLAINQQPVASSHSAASANGVALAPDSDSIDSRQGIPPAEKKERGGGDWYDVGSQPARQMINAALGRHPSRALSSAEMHEVAQFAAQYGGKLGAEDFAVLRDYLQAEPVFDTGVTSAWESVPEGSLLRKRRRFAGQVIADLANQIEFARKWAASRSVISGARNNKDAEPDGDWRAFAREKLGIDTELAWSLLLPRFRDEITVAWNAQSKEGEP